MVARLMPDRLAHPFSVSDTPSISISLGGLTGRFLASDESSRGASPSTMSATPRIARRSKAKTCWSEQPSQGHQCRDN